MNACGRSELPHPVVHRRVVDRLEQLVQVALDPMLHLKQGRPNRDTRSVAVKLGRPPPDGDHGVLLDDPCRQCRGRGAPFVVAAHLDQELDRPRVILVGQLDPRVRRRHPAHAEVDVGRQPPVEPYLLAAHLPPPLRGPVVDELERQRLLELIRPIAGEEHQGDVGLADLYVARMDRVGVGACERPADVLRRGHRRPDISRARSCVRTPSRRRSGSSVGAVLAPTRRAPAARVA
jgi:hypothetical protein